MSSFQLKLGLALMAKVTLNSVPLAYIFSEIGAAFCAFSCKLLKLILYVYLKSLYFK